MIIKNRFRHFAGMTINMPEMGAVKVDENCMLEVPDDLGKKLIDGAEWKRVKAEGEEDDDDEAGEEKVAPSADLQALLTSIDAMTLPDLVELATESGIKGWEKFKDKEKVLRVYLKNKLKANG